MKKDNVVERQFWSLYFGPMDCMPIVSEPVERKA